MYSKRKTATRSQDTENVNTELVLYCNLLFIFSVIHQRHVTINSSSRSSIFPIQPFEIFSPIVESHKTLG